jgi:multicomponent Na+:H+ antiporter subunit E
LLRNLSFIFILASVWLLWSGLTFVVWWQEGALHVEHHAMLIGFMIGSVGLVVWLSKRMNAVDQESHPVEYVWRPLVYGGWLVKEIVMSNLHIAAVIMDRDLPIHPQLVRINTTQTTDVGHVIHANSITITPGTVSLDVRDGTILVHALTHTTAEGVQSGEMDRWVTWLEGSS